MTQQSKFWAVWKVDGGSPPHKRHTTFESAKAEAERLATQSQGDYYVLEVVGVVRRPVLPMEYTAL
jgi:hypothetical protein